jgi:hypothetical protein
MSPEEFFGPESSFPDHDILSVALLDKLGEPHPTPEM